MEIQYWWWLLALALGIAEILTGTFYLLVLALACAVGGVAAWAGLSEIWQFLIVAAGAIAGWALLRRHRARAEPGQEALGDGQMRLDVGQSLQIDQWQEDRRTVVRYRGAQWQVELAPGGDPGDAGAPGSYRIARIENNRLIVTPVHG